MSPPDQPSRYHIHVFWSDEDQCWIADAPDLQFCSAHGQTPAEAVAELEVAVDAWLEAARERGLAIPQPRYRPPGRLALHAGSMIGSVVRQRAAYSAP